MPEKLTYEFVKSSFEKDGCKLLSKDYVNNHTKLHYVCAKNHRHAVMWRNWQRGDRCPICAGQSKPELWEIRRSFKLAGYTLLSTEYKNNKTKLKYICSNGHEHSIRWSDWLNFKRCPHCAGVVKVTLGQVEDSMRKEGYTLLSDTYFNNFTKLRYKCSNGHEHNMSWGNWITGYRCPTCASIKMSGPGHPNWQGGLSYEPYCPIWKDKEYKADIKERDDYRCLNPLCGGNDDRLHIHHVDYNKKNCEPKNLITLCGSCNSKANYDRDWHTSWYQAILSKRCNYTY